MNICRAMIALALVSATAGYLPSHASTQTGKNTIDSLVQIFSSWSGDVKDRSTYNQAAKYIDYQGMAQRSLTAAQWSKLSPEQRKSFIASLRALIEERYYTRWHRIFKKGTLAYQGESGSAGDTIVKTQLTVGKKVDALEWRLDNVGGERRVVSLAVGKSDLLNKLSTRLQARLDKVGFNELLRWMKIKASAGPGDGAEASK